MPHIHLETNYELPENQGIDETLVALIEKLASFDTIDSKNIKAYHTARSRYATGDGAPPGFVHCCVSILAGRPLELRQQIGQGIAETLRDRYADSFESGQAGLTIEVREMDRATYIK